MPATEVMPFVERHMGAGGELPHPPQLRPDRPDAQCRERQGQAERDDQWLIHNKMVSRETVNWDIRPGIPTDEPGRITHRHRDEETFVYDPSVAALTADPM